MLMLIASRGRKRSRNHFPETQKTEEFPTDKSYKKYYFSSQLAETGRKQLEQLMQQLQEQLQINLLQQTHMMQTGRDSKNEKASAGALQQLHLQQQQVISQLQIVQQRLIMVL